jgi:hypothetical protein
VGTATAAEVAAAAAEVPSATAAAATMAAPTTVGQRRGRKHRQRGRGEAREQGE